jgi:hypothetical protein
MKSHNRALEHLERRYNSYIHFVTSNIYLITSSLMMKLTIYYSLYWVLTSLTIFSPLEVATTLTILWICNGQKYWWPCLWMLSLYIDLRLYLCVYGCETSRECVYGWFLCAYGYETWLIVFVVVDLWTEYYECVDYVNVMYMWFLVY